MFGCPNLLPLPLVAVAAAIAAAPTAHAAAADTVRVALASPALGKASPTFGGSTLIAGRPATVTRSALTLPVASTRLGPTSTASLSGHLTLRAGRRTLMLRGLRLTVTSRATSLSATTGGARVTVLRSRTGATPRGTILTLRRGALKLTAAGSRAMRTTLGRRVRAGTTLGVVSGTLGRPTVPTGGATTGPPATTTPRPVTGTAPAATTPPPSTTPPTTTPPTTNVYTAPCTTAPATLPTAGPGTPPPAPLPALTTTSAVTSASTLTWGVRESWRWYLKNLGGLTAAWDGATVGPDTTTSSGPAFGIFTFPGAPAGGGAYEQGATAADDRAIVPLRGRVDFCHGTHGFRITLSNPTVVIDGANSRIVADADTNHDGTLMPNERLDIARLDLTAITPVRAAGTVTWTGVPATFLQGGAKTFSGTGTGGGGSYPAGSPMDPVTVVATTGP